MKKKVKNIKINIAEIILLTSIGITGISFLKNLNIKDDDVITVAEEIEAMKEASLKEKEIVSLDVSLKDEIDKQIDEYYTQRVLDEQFDKFTDELIEEEIEKYEESYSGMNVTHEYEDYLKDKCLEYSNKYNIDYDTLYKIVMTVGYQESSGNWNSNSKISETDDYGEFQINVCNLDDAEKRFGYTRDDMLNNKYKNADYFVDRICNIMHLDSCKTLEDVFGINNGWIEWKNKPISRNYSKSCMEIMNNYFNDAKDITIK